MAPYVPKYVRPEDATRSRTQLIRRLIWVAVAIPLLFVFFLYGYSDQAPTGLRNAIISVVLSVGTWYLFYVGLGIKMPAGVLTGVL